METGYRRQGSWAGSPGVEWAGGFYVQVVASPPSPPGRRRRGAPLCRAGNRTAMRGCSDVGGVRRPAGGCAWGRAAGGSCVWRGDVIADERIAGQTRAAGGNGCLMAGMRRA